MKLSERALAKLGELIDKGIPFDPVNAMRFCNIREDVYPMEDYQEALEFMANYMPEYLQTFGIQNPEEYADYGIMNRYRKVR